MRFPVFRSYFGCGYENTIAIQDQKICESSLFPVRILAVVMEIQSLSRNGNVAIPSSLVRQHVVYRFSFVFWLWLWKYNRHPGKENLLEFPPVGVGVRLTVFRSYFGHSYGEAEAIEECIVVIDERG